MLTKERGIFKMKKSKGLISLSIVLAIIFNLFLCVAVSAEKVKITFDFNGGFCEGVEGNSVEIKTDDLGVLGIRYSNYNFANNLNRDGYVFDGWYTDSKGGERIVLIKHHVFDKDQRLYARWINKSLEKDDEQRKLRDIEGRASFACWCCNSNRNCTGND